MQNLLGILDTNTLLRFLLDDIEDQAQVVAELLDVETEKGYHVTDLVIQELVYVLSTHYQYGRQEIVGSLRNLLMTDVFVWNKDVVNRAFEIFVMHNISYVDAYLSALSELVQVPLYTFDRDMLKMAAFDVRQP